MLHPSQSVWSLYQIWDLMLPDFILEKSLKELNEETVKLECQFMIPSQGAPWFPNQDTKMSE